MLYHIYQVNSNTKKYLDYVMGADSALKRINYLAGKNIGTKFMARDSDGVILAEAIINVRDYNRH